ncbi:pentapeptide repeat-containing protein [Nostoc sp. LEGE 12450]|uniref:pentapeptide repeat-containing protein n=1 Tax=Nostoc sp. LEGE 12450 TaxID=1828643 RepID=UPI001882BB49|nr:pentapeptide repeat-containing protein [Nostoc sp. LEGE 12450]MBE8990878.1 pentapeptide repeat-containing protein [Nostoc sp. LEGE 12450]
MERERVTVEEFLRRYAAGERDFQQILLEYADLSGVELKGISLDGAQFSYVNLSSIKLWDCNLKAQFIYCNFRDALIENCNFDWAWFYDCDLRGSNIRLCDVTSTHFIRVNLQGATRSNSGKDPCEYWDVVREDGVFVPGFTLDLYIAERIAENKTRGNDVF